MLLCVMGGGNSLHRNASVEAIYSAPTAGEDVLCIVHAILVQVGWQFF